MDNILQCCTWIVNTQDVLRIVYSPCNIMSQCFKELVVETSS